MVAGKILMKKRWTGGVAVQTGAGLNMLRIVVHLVEEGQMRVATGTDDVGVRVDPKMGDAEIGMRTANASLRGVGVEVAMARATRLMRAIDRGGVFLAEAITDRQVRILISAIV